MGEKISVKCIKEKRKMGQVSSTDIQASIVNHLIPTNEIDGPNTRLSRLDVYKQNKSSLYVVVYIRIVSK